MKSLTLLLAASLALPLPAMEHPLEFMTWDGEPELRLRLKDIEQEIRTTSVNWEDLKVFEKKVVRRATDSAPVVPIEEPQGFRIIIDAGHGGSDLGAEGVSGVYEKNTVLRIARLVKQELDSQAKLMDMPVVVAMTREKDQFVSLEDRVKTANQWGADVFVSIHGNSSTVQRVKGFEVYFLDAKPTDKEAARVAAVENAGQRGIAVKSDVLSILSNVKRNLHINQSAGFAEKIYDSMSDRLRPNKRGVRQAPFTVLSGTDMPAVLVEVGYVSNPEEDEKLRRGHYLKRVANAISSGIVSFLMQWRGVG